MSAGGVDVHTARRRQQAGAVLVDIRDPQEQASGMAEGALAIPNAALQRDPHTLLPAADDLLLICQSGQRSRACADALRARGYTQVHSVAGGTQAWIAAGLPLNRDAPDADFLQRYDRHLRLPQVGLEGQRRLQQARVLLVGAGGLGSPAALYLAAAGVGYLRIVDDDVIERSNLQRQILHADADIGRAKVASAAARLHALNPTIVIEPIAQRVDASNVDALLDGVDVALDGADNFPVRDVLNAACVRHGIPMVYGAIQRFSGQVSVFAGGEQGSAPCYRCLFPEAPSDAPNCAEAGVLGVLPGIIGSLQAAETLKLLLGIGTPLIGRVLHLDVLTMQMRTSILPPDSACPVCGTSAP